MASTFKGQVWKFGDDINTDLVIPGSPSSCRSKSSSRHCFSANRPGWVDEVSPATCCSPVETSASARPDRSAMSSSGWGSSASSPSPSTDSACATASTPGCRRCPVAGVLDGSTRATSPRSTGRRAGCATSPRGRRLTAADARGAPGHRRAAGGVEAVLRSEGYLASPLDHEQEGEAANSIGDRAARRVDREGRLRGRARDRGRAGQGARASIRSASSSPGCRSRPAGS